MKILIADDDRVLSQLLSSRLRAVGFEVMIAFDAMQSLMVAMRNAPAAIILDLNMPGGAGLEVLKKLKSFNKTSSIPVIVLSGSIDPVVGSTTAKDLGAEEFFAKPPDFEGIHQTLNRLLSKIPSTIGIG